MAETEKEAYLALIAARDAAIRALLDQGFEFVTNAFKADAAQAGMKARTDREHVRRLQQAGYHVEVSAAYDEQGNPRPTLSAISGSVAYFCVETIGGELTWSAG